MNFVVSLVWRSRWLLGGAVIIAAAVAFAMAQTNAIEVWSGRIIITTGTAPTTGFLLIGSEPTQDLIEPTRVSVARLSDPKFKAEVLNHTPFAAQTADLSRSLVWSSLRGIALDSDREFAIELTAASSADTEAALRAFSSEIIKLHGALLDERLHILQGRLDSSRARLAAIEKSSDQLADRLLGAPDDKNAPRTPLFNLIPAWNDLEDRIQRDENLVRLCEPSMLHFEPGVSVQGPRRVAALRNSLLAGFAMFVAMFVLTIALNLRTRPNPR
jgi:hypothetical protein